MADQVNLMVNASCDRVTGAGLTCMACGDADAITHVRVQGGPNDGRLLLVVCAACADPADGMRSVKAALVRQMGAGLLSTDLGPGDDGCPEVWHRDHLDPLPTFDHEESS